MQKFLSRLLFWLLVVLIIGTPLHALVSTFLLYKVGLGEFSLIAFLIAAWKEILLAVMIGGLGLWQLEERKKITNLQWFSLAFVVLAVMVTMVNGLTMVNYIWGARTELLWLVWGVMLVENRDIFSEVQQKQILKCLVGVAMVILVFGLVLLVTGHDWLVNLGFRNDWSTFYAGEAPAFCQKEGGTEFCRLQSTFAGPNRYAGYLLVLAPIFVAMRKWLWLGVIGISLLATLSMSAWVAVIAGVILLVAWRLGLLQKRRVTLGMAVVLAVFLMAGLVGNFDKPAEFLDVSSSLHIQRFFEAQEMFKEQPLGYGLAASGPAAYKVEGLEAFIPESWLMQVNINQGILGFLLLMTIIGLLARRGQGIWLSAPLILVALQNIFLHTLEDPGVYVAMFTVLSLDDRI